MADFFEATAHLCGDPKLSANWVMGEMSAALNRDNLEIVDAPLSPEDLGQLIGRIKDDTISSKIAKSVFEAAWHGEGSVDTIIAAKGLRQMSDSGALEAIVDSIIAGNPDQVAQFRAGKHKVLGFFVGQVMQATQGKANPKQVNEILRRRLQE